MTRFEDLTLVYNQFINLSAEIKDLVENEEYSEVLTKISSKNKLITKLINARKTIEISDENKSQIEAMDKEIMEKDQENLAIASKIHKELGDELKSTHKKVKINTAYSIQKETTSGIYVNITE